MRPNDVVEDAAENICRIIIRKIIHHANSSKDVRVTACDEAKAAISKQIERVRAVLQPGVTVSETIIAADLFVVNSTERWPDWEKVARPSDKDLADHPWYHLYYKEGGKHLARPTAAVGAEVTSGDKGFGGSKEKIGVKVKGQGKGLEDSPSRSARSASITVTTQSPTVAVPAAISFDNPCLACIDRGITCDRRPGYRCLQCQTRRRKCSHSVQVKRSRPGFLPPPAAKRARTQTHESAAHGLPLNLLRESHVTLGQADLPAPSRPPSPTQPDVSRDVSTDATFVSREDHDNLVRAYNERISIIEDRLLSLVRVVESTRRRVVQASGNPGTP